MTQSALPYGPSCPVVATDVTARGSGRSKRLAAASPAPRSPAEKCRTLRKLSPPQEHVFPTVGTDEKMISSKENVRVSAGTPCHVFAVMPLPVL